jgi:hypothetical protein
MTDNTIDPLASARETLANLAADQKEKERRNQSEQKAESEKPKTLYSRVQDIVIAARRFNKLYDAVKDLHDKVSPWVKPVLGVIGTALGHVKNAFNWAAYKRDKNGLVLDEDGDPIFSPGRLARTFGLAVMLGVASVGAVQTGYFYATKFNETVYVTGKQEIRDGETFQFTGCTSLPCSTQSDNGKYYRISQSLFSPLLLYPEQDVFANIPNQFAMCNVSGYGIYFRSLRRLHNLLDIHQQVYDVSCRPLTQQEMQGADQPSSNSPALRP